jgi:hypothetical protein
MNAHRDITAVPVPTQAVPEVPGGQPGTAAGLRDRPVMAGPSLPAGP